jgi:hypothetical protein
VSCFLDSLNQLVLVAVRAECVEAFFVSAVRGLPASRVSPRRATYFLLLRQEKVSKEKATRWSGTLRFATGNLWCSTKAGSRSNSPAAQTIASPDPLLPALLGPARRVREKNTKTNSGRRGRAWRVLAGARFRTRSRPHHPSGCAEERRSRRIRTGDCLSVASSSPAPAGPSTAGCPRSVSEGGHRQQGRLFFAYFLLATQMKVSCRRATPGLSEALAKRALANTPAAA